MRASVSILPLTAAGTRAPHRSLTPFEEPNLRTTQPKFGVEKNTFVTIKLSCTCAETRRKSQKLCDSGEAKWSPSSVADPPSAQSTTIMRSTCLATITIRPTRIFATVAADASVAIFYFLCLGRKLDLCCQYV